MRSVFCICRRRKKGVHFEKDAPLEMLFGIDVLFFAVANFIEEVCHL